MASCKPEFELFDLRMDPWEVHNVADDPAYGEIKEKLLTELNYWRENVIMDAGVSEAFRSGGWPSTYPTKTLKEWEVTLELFEPWVFREPGEDVKHPYYD